MVKTFDLLLKNGIVVNHDGAGPRDVGVTAGRIVEIGALSSADAGEVVDCAGLHVLPGVIDSQVHFREPGATHKEDLETGSRAAVLGGVVAVFEMPNTSPLTTTAEAIGDKLARARGRMFCDHAFYVGATHENARALAELELLPGVSGVKIFMGASTGDLLVPDDEGVREVLRHGRRRVAIHSEDESILREAKARARAGDWTSHPDARPPEAAVASTKRLLRLARETGRRIHVLHVSTAEEIPLLAAAKDIATAEATPQHLTLAAPDCYERLQGFAQMNPPVRDGVHRAGLWRGVAQGVIDVIGSDHAPHTRAEKEKPYPASPSGMPGVQTLLPLMLDHVAQGRLTLARLVDLVCHGPQRVFGIAGKGRLAVGYDADFTIVDLKARHTIAHAEQATKCGWTPFDGVTVTGWPVGTIIRGRRVMWEGEILGAPAGAPVRFQETLGPAPA
ncbi:dihydroorotase [Amphiplicatus metriothermophilus]|uniref:Dihydroorotase n=1 Tax=Amphiplicatus metriothermophilus TaxID=1519374 RepID=A0A239PM47_9PROT|nr:dihydroorotase [Amphiplicatus metriothermophilus]MBB5517225.1 dihydroorotase [Amphiplicatus metriothermophilus]SNT68439.1 dihydroorotase [Amphiplicatus metriothermophilus]